MAEKSESPTKIPRRVSRSRSNGGGSGSGAPEALPVLSEEELAMLFQSDTFSSKLNTSVAEAVSSSVTKALQEQLPKILPVSLGPTLELQTDRIQKALEPRFVAMESKMADFESRLNSSESRHVDMDLDDADQAELVQMRERLAKIETSVPAKLELSPDVTARFEALEAKFSSPGPSASPSLDGFSTPGATWAERLRHGQSPGQSPDSTSLPTVFTSPGGFGGGHPSGGGFVGSPGATGGNSFNRDIDPCIFKVSMACSWSKAECEKQTRKILDDAGVDGGFVVEGLQPSKSYSVRVEGSAQVASKWVRKVLDNQRLETSLWRKYYGNSLEKDSDNKCVTKLLFLNPDKNSKQVKSEMATRKLVQILTTSQSGKKFYASREDHIVSVGFKALARVVAYSQFDIRVQWNMELARSEGVNRGEIMSAFESEFAAGAGVNWV